MSVQIARKHFTVSEYYRMAETGIISEDDRVELIEGEVIEMTPIGIAHAACVKRLITLITRSTLTSIQLSIQDPIHLNQFSEPQPDIALLKFRQDYYNNSHPTASDVLLIIEVSDTSADYDRNIKLPLYAAAGILEVWLVDLNREVLEVYLQPGGRGYQIMKEYHHGEALSPQFHSALTLKVDDILG
jgi:Uma2 family endonuclease